MKQMQRLTSLLGAVAVAALTAPTVAHAQVRDVTGFTTNSFNRIRNDDDYMLGIDVGFNYDFFGLTGHTVNVSNNGFIAFGTTPSYTPEALSANRVIAAFWADVDTRNAASGTTTFGTGTVNVAGAGARNAFYVNWPGVGYYNSRADRLNTFQLFLIDRSDRAVGAFDFELNYGSMQWEAGDNNDGLSGNTGLGGAGAKCARAGYSNGSTVTFEVPGSDVCGALIDGGTNALNGQSFRFSATGSTVVQVPPTTTTPEPASFALAATGLVALGGVAARRRRTAA